MTYTEDAVLAHHGIPAENGLAYLRDVALVNALCLHCASIVVAPDAQSRLVYSRVMKRDGAMCCGAPMVVY